MSGAHKIDDLVVNGLLGVEDSLAYKVHENERHHHHWDRRMGLAAVPNGEIHRADSIIDNVEPFQANAGNDAWGTWLQVLGSSDTPIDGTNAFYDFHIINLVAVQRANATHLIQIGLGASGAAALIAGTYTELVFHPQSVQGAVEAIESNVRRQAVGTLAWLRVLVRGQNTGTIDFYIGLHEYEG